MVDAEGPSSLRVTPSLNGIRKLDEHETESVPGTEISPWFLLQSLMTSCPALPQGWTVTGKCMLSQGAVC